LARVQQRASHIKPSPKNNRDSFTVQSVKSANTSNDNLSSPCTTVVEDEGHEQLRNMAYTATYATDSDADDEFERQEILSPSVLPDLSPTGSEEMTTSEHTPTTFTHSQSGGSHASPTTTMITEWTTEQSAEYVRSLGLGQYMDDILRMIKLRRQETRRNADIC